jgi:hypothetical protein
VPVPWSLEWEQACEVYTGYDSIVGYHSRGELRGFVAKAARNNDARELQWWFKHVQPEMLRRKGDA